ncbi:MAG: hypothetical protein HQK50_11180 [Oligoflexia bacterium]|nr:hypothetical protein [Oligoflexia bacterium]
MNDGTKLLCFLARIAGMIPGFIEKFVYSTVDKLSLLFYSDPQKEVVTEEVITEEVVTEEALSEEPITSASTQEKDAEELVGSTLNSVPEEYQDFCNQVLPPKRMNPERP